MLEEVLNHWQYLARIVFVTGVFFYDDDGFGNIYGNFPDALQVGQVLMNTNSNTGTHTPTHRQTLKYVCMYFWVYVWVSDATRTHTQVHAHKKAKQVPQVDSKMYVAQFEKLLLQFVEFHFQFALKYFVVSVVVVVADLTVCGNLLQSCRLNVNHCPSLRRGRVRFSKIFYVTKLATNWEHRAEHKVGETREQQIESAQNVAEINGTHWHLECR